jgi:two-component system, OmpR family, response regulator
MLLAERKMTNGTQKKVLLVEDDAVLRGNYERLLGQYALSVRSSATALLAKELFDQERFDVVILDVALGADYEAGFELCQAFRTKRNDVPIIFLSERDDISDRISGLRLGADDYLSKTTATKYLVARIAALIRRMESIYGGQRTEQRYIDRSELTLDDQASCAYWKSIPLRLSLTQFWILRDLALNPGTIRSIDDIMRAANITVQPNTIVVHIKAIRGIFLEIDPQFECIKNERSRGYRWVNSSANMNI